MAAATALAAVLVLGVVRLGPPLAATLGKALSGIFAPGAPTAPGLDGFERALLAGATSADDDGPTLLDVRTHLRSRLDRGAADAAFGAVLRPLVARALAGASIASEAVRIDIVDRATEDAWVRDRLRPGPVALSTELAGVPVGMVAAVREYVFGIKPPADAFPPGRAAGDVVVKGRGSPLVVLRRRPGSGLTVVFAMSEGGAPLDVGQR